jgi:hypothetical protein
MPLSRNLSSLPPFAFLLDRCRGRGGGVRDGGRRGKELLATLHHGGGPKIEAAVRAKMGKQIGSTEPAAASAIDARLRFGRMLDVILFRAEQGGNPELVRESQRRRYADVGLVDQVIEYDQEWRKTRFALDAALTRRGKVQKEIGGYMKNKETPPAELLEQKQAAEDEIAELQTKEKEVIVLRDSTIGKIGNLVPDDVPISDDEANNLRVDQYGEFKREEWMLSHYDLVRTATWVAYFGPTSVPVARALCGWLSLLC